MKKSLDYIVESIDYEHDYEHERDEKSAEHPFGQGPVNIPLR